MKIHDLIYKVVEFVLTNTIVRTKEKGYVVEKILCYKASVQALGQILAFKLKYIGSCIY